jgi:hypothetical protein
VTNPVSPPDQLSLFDQAAAEPALRVRRSRRARRLSVRVFPHGAVEVVAPMRAGHREVQAFVDEHQGWIERARDEMAASGSAADISLPSRIELALSAERYGISYIDTRGRARLQKMSGGNLAIHHDRDDRDAARRLLRQWVRDRARDLLLPLLERLAARTGLEPTGVRIGRQRSRWGSCSSAGRVNLNCGLLFVRPPLVEYLIIHELCHLRHLNHSPRFWRLVGTHLPGYEALERELAASWTRVPGWLFYDA